MKILTRHCQLPAASFSKARVFQGDIEDDKETEQADERAGGYEDIQPFLPQTENVGGRDDGFFVHGLVGGYGLWVKVLLPCKLGCRYRRVDIVRLCYPSQQRHL